MMNFQQWNRQCQIVEAYDRGVNHAVLGIVFYPVGYPTAALAREYALGYVDGKPLGLCTAAIKAQHVERASAFAEGGGR